MTIPLYEPMLATRWPQPFDHPDWWFEVKWDGVRVIVAFDGADVSLRSRRGLRMDDIYPEFTRFRFDRPTVVDGEIVALGEGGAPSFSLLQQRMNVRGAKARTLVDQVPLTLMAFDLLHHGAPLVDEPIEDRWVRLGEIVPPNMVVSPATREHGQAVFAAVVDRGLEGIVAKKAGSRYKPGTRAEEWRKVVHRTSARFVVGGYLPGQRGRSTTFASLMLGLWDDGRLRFVGSAGSGFDDHALRHIRAALDQMERPTSPFTPDPTIPRQAKWVEPTLVAVVEYREWTHDHHLRAPVFKGFVTDPVELVTWEAEGPDS